MGLAEGGLALCTSTAANPNGLSEESEGRSSRTEPGDTSMLWGQKEVKEPAKGTEKEHPVSRRKTRSGWVS